MGHVEIWKSKPEWNQASAEEQNRVQRALAELVQRHWERTDGTCGPFMPCNRSGCTLVWEVRNSEAGRLRKDYDRILGRWFIPVMSGAVGGLTAKDYADHIATQD